MTLKEAVDLLKTFFDEDALDVERTHSEWRADSLTFVVEEPKDGALTQIIDGVEVTYVLPVFLAREVLEVWRKWRNQKEPTGDEKTEAIIHYAQYDAHLGENDKD